MGVNDLTKKVEVLMTTKLAYKLKVMSEYKNEIAGWIIGGNNPQGQILLEDILIPPQEVSSGEVELNTSNSESDKWLLKNHSDMLDKMICHIHSHNTMGAFFSSGDELNHEKLMSGRKFLIFLVIAKTKEGDLFEYSCKIGYKMKSPFGLDVFGEVGASIKIIGEEDTKELKSLHTKLENTKKLKEEIEEKVKGLDTKIENIKTLISNLQEEKILPIREEIEKIINERIRERTYASNWDWKAKDSDLDLYGRNLNTMNPKPKQMGNRTMWSLTYEDLTPKQADILKEMIDHVPTFIDCDVIIDKFGKIVGKVDVFIDCHNKKMAMEVKKAVEELLGDDEVRQNYEGDKLDSLYDGRGEYMGVDYGY